MRCVAVLTVQSQRISRPLPHPPSHHEAPCSIHPYPTSLASAPYSAQPPSSAQLHPASIDRRNLVGVGELSTPRWPGSGFHSRTPSMPHNMASPSSRLPPLPQTPTIQQGDYQRSTSATQSPPRPVHTTSPATQPTREVLTAPNTAAHDGSLYSLASLAQFNFDSTMEASLAASLATLTTSPKVDSPKVNSPKMNSPKVNSPKMNSPKSPVLPQLDSILPPSPGSARSRIYARRQERANAAASISQPGPSHQSISHSTSQPQSISRPQPPAESTFSPRRDSRKTPPNPSRHNPSHDILKQFAVKDFSHLPPSPSSASINHFLRASGSTQTISSGTPPASASASNTYFPSKGVQREDSQKSQKSQKQQRTTPKPRELDPNVDEALRKLDGLTSTPGKNRTRGKSSGGPSAASSRPGTPVAESKSRSEGKISSKPSIGSFKDATGSPLNNWIDLTEDVPAIPIPRPRIPPNHESSSSASVTDTPNSHDSQSLPTTATTMSSADLANNNKPRRASGGSDTFAPQNVDQQPEETEKSIVPPVPPLPQVYVNKKQTMPVQSSAMPVHSNAMQPPNYVPMREPASPISSPSESRSPSSTTAPVPVPVPPKMHKKWSFSSALNLKSATSPASSVDEMTMATPQSPQTPWSEIHRAELFSPSSSVQGQDSGGDSGPQGATPLAPPPPPPPPSSKASNVNKRLTPSSIPFFCRSSSSSFQSKASQPAAPVPETPKQTEKTAAATVVPSSQSSRKSVLGMHFPSMLRGSSSKRGLAQQTGQSQVSAKEKEGIEPTSAPSATSGWTGRKRGKVRFFLVMLFVIND